MRVKILTSLLAAAAGALALAGSAQALPAPDAASQISGAINNAQLVTLNRNTRPEATSANDRGAVTATKPLDIELLLRRSPANEKIFEKIIADLSNPKSTSFHKWLTNAEIAKYGPSVADVAKVTAWLSSQGLSVHGVSPDRTIVAFAGTAAQVDAAFHTSIHNLSVKGVAHFANMSDPEIPAALASVVAGPVALHNFRGHTDLIKKRAGVSPIPAKGLKGTSGAKGTSSDGNTFYITPEDLATIYNLTPLFQSGINGKGQTIVVLEDGDVYKQSDWNLFRAVTGLSVYKDAKFTQTHPTGTGTCTDPGVNDVEGEAAIDVDWASAGAPDANIVLASCADVGTAVTGFGGLIALQNLTAQASPPQVISLSYGECEVANGASGNLAFKTAYQTAVAKGITIFVSSGDENASSCDYIITAETSSSATVAYEAGIGVSGWTSTAYNVSVGGTDFGTLPNLCQAPGSYPACMSAYWKSTNDKVYGSAKSYMVEIPWNDSCGGQIVSTFSGYPAAYGSTGFCNSATATGTNFSNTYIDNTGGSGGPSGCATGRGTGRADVVNGTCAGYAKPAFQAGFAGIVADGKRDIPDVSLFASNGFWASYYVVCDSDNAGCSGANPQNWAGYGGTSVSSPIMAGVQALINQKTGQSWGQVNTQFYALAAQEYGATGNAACNSSLGSAIGSSCIFNDVTAGDMVSACGASLTLNLNTANLNITSEGSLSNTANCYKPSGTVGVLSTSSVAYQPAYGTGTGWDFSTGIGTINAYNLVNAFTQFTSAPVIQ